MDLLSSVALVSACITIAGLVIAGVCELVDRPLSRRVPAPRAVPLQQRCPTCQCPMMACWIVSQPMFYWCSGCRHKRYVGEVV
jgi:hypothetical protein